MSDSHTHRHYTVIKETYNIYTFGLSYENTHTHTHTQHTSANVLFLHP